MGVSIYEMYRANGDRADFWAWRPSYGDKIIRIVRIGDYVMGELPEKTFAYEADPRVWVEAYVRQTGKLLHTGHMNCPRRRSYKWLTVPSWWGVK